MGASLPVDLNPGEAAFLDLARNALPNGTPIRVEVRPVVTLEPGPTPSICLASAETFDAVTGRTWVPMPVGPPNSPSP